MPFRSHFNFWFLIYKKNSFSGYLVSSLFLRDDNELVMLLVNTIQKVNTKTLMKPLVLQRPEGMGGYRKGGGVDGKRHFECTRSTTVVQTLIRGF